MKVFSTHDLNNRVGEVTDAAGKSLFKKLIYFKITRLRGTWLVTAI